MYRLINRPESVGGKAGDDKESVVFFRYVHLIRVVARCCEVD